MWCVSSTPERPPQYGGRHEVRQGVRRYGGGCHQLHPEPVHNEDYFVKLAMKLEKMGADTICIKDMANLLLPMTPILW